MTTQEPMSERQLAQIGARVTGDDDAAASWNGALEQAEADRAALLAEVERQRALADTEYRTIQALHREIARLRERLDEPSGLADGYVADEQKGGGDGQR